MPDSKATETVASPSTEPVVAEVAKTLVLVGLIKATELWPVRLPEARSATGLRDEVVEDVAVDVGQASVDAVGTIRQLGVINP